MYFDPQSPQDSLLEAGLAADPPTREDRRLVTAADKWGQYRRALEVRENPHLESDRLRTLSGDVARPVRYFVAGHRNTPPEVLERLVEDPVNHVAHAAFHNPRLPARRMGRSAAFANPRLWPMPVMAAEEPRAWRRSYHQRWWPNDLFGS